MPLPSTAGYAEAADALVEQYESVAFTEVHRDVLHLFPLQPSTIVDIGAGSGRDAAALAALGHSVTAVEPTAELRRLGQRIHAGQTIEWVDDALPDLTALRAEHTDDGRRFDLILLTAVWMHLDAGQRASAMGTIAGLLGDGGQIILSLRHGPVPPGRCMFTVSAQETIELARHHGLTVTHHSERADPHARADVSWSYLGLRRGDG